jgi:L-asparaginase
MAYRRKKVLLLFAGGTTLDARDRPGDSVKKSGDVRLWMDRMPELSIIADLDPEFVYGGEAAGIGAEQWVALAQRIREGYRDYDGFLVLHGLETLPATAVALSFMLQGLARPVVLTGSPLRTREERRADPGAGEYRGMGIKANLVNALQVATGDLTGVVVVFGSRIIPGVRAMFAPPGSSHLFESFGDAFLGRIDLGIRYAPLPARRGAFRAVPAIDSHVVTLDFKPGVPLELFDASLTGRAHGILVTLTTGSVLPTEAVARLKRVEARGVPVVLFRPGTTPPPRATYPFPFLAGISGTAAVIKFMWALGQTRDHRKLVRLLQQDLAGEFVERRKP